MQGSHRDSARRGSRMTELRNRCREVRHWWEARLLVKRDAASGLLYQKVYGGRVFLRDNDAYLPKRQLEWLCREVYFGEYMPQPDDTVVDIGVGYGHEALYCHVRSPGVKYIGIEVQPSVYECLANTLSPYRPKLRAFPLAISDEAAVWLDSAAGDKYELVRTTSAGAVEIPTVSWPAFLERFSVRRVSLLKVNIEGGERDLFPALGALDAVDRVIVSAHDFRAERGEGERFRTRQFVMDYLSQAGFRPRSVRDEPWWRDWIFADRRRDERHQLSG